MNSLSQIGRVWTNVSQTAAPIVNLRNTNPYVSSAIGDWRKGAAKLTAHVSRAAAPASKVAPHTAAGKVFASLHLYGSWNDYEYINNKALQS